MVIVLQFELSTLVHLERTCKYRWPCATLHWDQTQLHRSPIPECILVVFHWDQNGLSFFSRKVDCYHHYHVSPWVVSFIFWVLRVLTCLWVAYQHFFIFCSLYNYTCDRSCGTWTRQAWDLFDFPSCGLIPNFYHTCPRFSFLSLCFFVCSIYALN